MRQNIGIRMPQKPLFVRDLHAAQNQLAAFHQLMHIISMANTHLFFSSQVFRGCDLIVFVVAGGKLYPAARLFKQAAVIRYGIAVYFFKALQIQCTVKALRGLHRHQIFAGRCAFYHGLLAVFHKLNGVFYCHSRGRCAAAGCRLQRTGDHLLAHKGPGGIVYGQQLALGRHYAAAHTLCAGAAAAHHLHRLAAPGCKLFCPWAVFARHKNQFGNIRVRIKGFYTAL